MISQVSSPKGGNYGVFSGGRRSRTEKYGCPFGGNPVGVLEKGRFFGELRLLKNKLHIGPPDRSNLLSSLISSLMHALGRSEIRFESQQMGVSQGTPKMGGFRLISRQTTLKMVPSKQTLEREINWTSTSKVSNSEKHPGCQTLPCHQGPRSNAFLHMFNQ